MRTCRSTSSSAHVGTSKCFDRAISPNWLRGKFRRTVPDVRHNAAELSDVSHARFRHLVPRLLQHNLRRRSQCHSGSTTGALAAKVQRWWGKRQGSHCRNATGIGTAVRRL
jgi:hypothetical protein